MVKWLFKKSITGLPLPSTISYSKICIWAHTSPRDKQLILTFYQDFHWYQKNVVWIYVSINSGLKLGSPLDYRSVKLNRCLWMKHCGNFSRFSQPAQWLRCSTQGAEAGLAEPVPGKRVKGRQNAGVSPGSNPTRHKALPTVGARQPEGVTSRGLAGGEEGQQYTCSYICSPNPWCLGGWEQPQYTNCSIALRCEQSVVRFLLFV